MFFRIAAGIMLLSCAVLSAADLVKDGVPCADIVISENPGPGVLAAAQDLQKHIRLMSGAELKIVTPEKSEMPSKICVGESACSKEAGYVMPKFRGSGYDIWIKGPRIVLSGPVTLHRKAGKKGSDKLSGSAALNIPGRTVPAPVSDRLVFSLPDDLGPMHAVSAFLENLGVRFYAPYENGTIIPQKKTISVPAGRETREAAFGVREYQYGAEVSDSEGVLWLKHLKSGSASSAAELGVLDLADLMRSCEKDHPDWLAHDKKGEIPVSRDGCGFPKYLQAGFQKACAEKIRGIFDADPDMKKLIVMPPEGSNSVDSGELGKMTKPGVYPRSPRRELPSEFTSALARELKKTHPDRRIVWMGPDNDSLPDAVRQAGRTDDNLTAAPRAHAPHLYARIGGSDKYLKDLGAMNEAFHPGGMIQREWWNEFEDPETPRLPFWFLKTLREVRKGQKEHGMAGVLTDLASDRKSGLLTEVPLTHLMIYVNSKLMWDPELDLDALLAEYCRLWFGPAESEMLLLFHYGANIMSRKGIRTPSGSPQSQMRFDDVPVIFQLLERARKKTQEGTVYRSRVEALEKSLAWLKTLYEKPAAGPEKKAQPVLLTAQPFPCDRKCTGDLSVFRNWIPLGKSEGADRTELALGVTDNRDRLLVAVRCFDEKMTDIPAAVLRPDDPAVLKGDAFRITLRSPNRGPFYLVVNPDGSFLDGSPDSASVIQTGSVLGWSADKTKVTARRLADCWEAEIHFALTMGGPWPDDQNPPWTLCVERIRRNAVKAEAKGASEAACFALAFPDVDSEGKDIHARRLLPGAADQYVYGVKKASGPVPMDAAWDGPEWRNVPELQLGINWHRYGLSSDYYPDARAKLQYDDQYLYVRYLVNDQYVKAEFQTDQGSVCLDSCMEFFAKPVESGPYLNFECNCIGTLLLYHITENADGSKSMVPLKSEELESIRRWHTLYGPINQEIERPTVWHLALRIPLSIFVDHAGIKLPLSGQVWSANFFNCADTTSHPRWLMWKRAKAFHTPEDFGKLIFE